MGEMIVIVLEKTWDEKGRGFARARQLRKNNRKEPQAPEVNSIKNETVV